MIDMEAQRVLGVVMEIEFRKPCIEILRNTFISLTE